MRLLLYFKIKMSKRVAFKMGMCKSPAAFNSLYKVYDFMCNNLICIYAGLHNFPEPGHHSTYSFLDSA